jgi:hypothetical protein
MKQLLESWNNYIIQEASIRQVLNRFNSSKFLSKSEFFQVSPQKAKSKIEESVPQDLDIKEKAVYLDWRISNFLKTGNYEGPDSSVVKDFFEFKDKDLFKTDLLQIQTIEDFEGLVNSAREKLGNKEKKKEEESTSGSGQNLIYEDENWFVYIPETKGASIALCDGPDPRPIKQGGTRARWCTGSIRRKYYEQYHTEDNPLIIFISKSNPKQKYQFSYFGTPLWRNKPEFKDALEKEIDGTNIFYELNDIVKGLGDKLPERVVAEANKY